ncbi:MAG TPA: uracil-DNA glycosylase, partial [Candidatus Limnocylindria bacterium]
MQDPLAALADEIRACTACPLHRSAKQAVPGEGSAESGIFFLGEAPGYNEDVQGRPFVGAAGHLLDQLLAGIGLDRSKVFITNVVRHRPPENRDPLPEEVAACHVWFERHLAALKPKVVVTLGRHAMYKFFPGESISRVHG